MNHWNLLSRGDLCLSYTKGHFPVCGRVSAKAHSAEVARAIWGTREDDGRTWEYMWVFDEMLPVNASSETVRVALGRAVQARPPPTALPPHPLPVLLLSARFARTAAPPKA